MTAAKSLLDEATNKSQYQNKMQEEKYAMQVSLEDKQDVSAGLCLEMKSKVAIIAQLNSKLTTLTTEGRALKISLDKLHAKLAVAETTERTSREKWNMERQQLQDEVAWIRREDLSARADHDAEYKQWMIRNFRDSKDPGTGRESANPSSLSNQLFNISEMEYLTPFRGQHDRHSLASEQKGLGSDVPMSLRSGATLNSRYGHDGHCTKHAQWATSNTVKCPSHTGKWVRDTKMLTVTISERLKIASSRALADNPKRNWRDEWTMNVFLRALEEVYALDKKGRFMDTSSI